MATNNMAAAQSESVRSKILPNGVRVVCEHVPGSRLVSVGVWLDTGSRHDPDNSKGAAHFIEHMLFKGTRTRTAKDISEAIDSVGGVLNAFTAKEYTCVYAKTLAEDFGLAADIIADMLLESTFEPELLERERSVILEEISTYEDAPDELVLDLLESIVWQNSKMGNPILGEAVSVEKISADGLLSHYCCAYGAPGLVVAVSGGADLESASEFLGEKFGSFRRSAKKQSDVARSGARAKKIRQKQIEQLHLCLGATGLSADDPRLYTMHVLNNALGGGTSSRLFQKVREERGLAYSVYSFHSSYRDTGVLGIYVASTPALGKPLLSLIREELEDIRQTPMTLTEIERCKRQLKGSLLLGLEGCSSKMMRIGRSMTLLGRVVGLSEVIERIDSVGAEQVMELAQQTLDPSRLSIAMVGPELDLMQRIASDLE